jgi:hypothetical protein
MGKMGDKPETKAVFTPHSGGQKGKSEKEKGKIEQGIEANCPPDKGKTQPE